jgi:hypothetical protein
MVSLRRAHLNIEFACYRFVIAINHKLKSISPDVADTVTNLRKILNSYVNPTSSIGFWKRVVASWDVASWDIYLRMTLWTGWMAKRNGDKKEVEMTNDLQLWVKGAWDNKHIDSIHKKLMNQILKEIAAHNPEN